MPDEVADRILAAAADCFARSGPQGTTIEDVAAAAGVSRATLYRRFPSRDALFVGVALREAEPFLARGRAVLGRPGPLAQRLEDALTDGIVHLTERPVIRALFALGVSPANVALSSDAFRGELRSILAPVLAAGQAGGEVRPDLDVAELTDWLVDDAFLLGTRAPWPEQRLRQRIRDYLLPVVVPDALRRPGARARAVEAALRAVHDQMDGLRAAVDALHRELSAGWEDS